MFDDALGYIASQYDAVRASIFVVSTMEQYHAAIPWLAPWSPALALGFAGACIMMLSKHSKWAVATPFATLGQKWRNWRRERVMRKERYNNQHTEMQSRIVTWIEHEVAGNRMTRVEANEWYANFAISGFQELRHCIDKPKNLLEKCMWCRENQDRDTAGNIVPLPLPGKTKEGGKRPIIMKKR